MKPYVVFVTGQISSGKTTVCRALVKQLGFDYISSDNIRAALGCPEKTNNGGIVFNTIAESIRWHKWNSRPLIVESTGLSYRMISVIASVPDTERFIIRLTTPGYRRHQFEFHRTDRAQSVPKHVLDLDLPPGLQKPDLAYNPFLENTLQYYSNEDGEQGYVRSVLVDIFDKFGPDQELADLVFPGCKPGQVPYAPQSRLFRDAVT